MDSAATRAPNGARAVQDAGVIGEVRLCRRPWGLRMGRAGRTHGPVRCFHNNTVRLVRCDGPGRDVLTLDEFFFEVGDLYERQIVDTGKQLQVLILVTFVIAFVCIRLVTHAIRAGRFRRLLRGVVVTPGTHIHHLVPGIILLLVAGYLGIGLPTYHRAPQAVLFGIGAALTLDEFALWFHLEDVYWERRGRRSVDAVIVATALSLLAILGSGFWIGLGELAGRIAGVI